MLASSSPLSYYGCLSFVASGSILPTVSEDEEADLDELVHKRTQEPSRKRRCANIEAGTFELRCRCNSMKKPVYRLVI